MMMRISPILLSHLLLVDKKSPEQLLICSTRVKVPQIRQLFTLELQHFRPRHPLQCRGYNAEENRTHATLLHLLGIDHTRFQGRDFRLTDVHGKLIKPVLA